MSKLATNPELLFPPWWKNGLSKLIHLPIPWWADCFALWLTVVLILSGVGLLSTRVLEPGEGIPPNLGVAADSIPGIWARWDSSYYLTVATNGYQNALEEHTLGFFPLYPLLINGLAHLTHLKPAVAGMVISQFSYLVAILLFYQVARLIRDDHQYAMRCTLFLVLFPTSFFYLAIYAESLYLALAILTVYLLLWPLPRLWYFPGTAQTLFVATADSHQDPGAAVAELLHHVEKYKGHASVYYLPPLYDEWRGLSQLARWQLADLSLLEPAYLPSPEQITAWRERGHEFTMHPLIETDLETSWTRYWQHFTALDYGPLSATARTHLVHWHPWVETARVQASYGIRLNLDFYHYGPSLKDEDGVWRYGHFTGSGRPMRFMDEQGRLLNVYQQVTHLADDHLLTMAWGNMVGLEPKEAISVSQTLLRQSLDGFYSAITAIFHADMFREGEPWSDYEAEWLDGTLEYAAAHHIPIWSAEAWLHFNEQRNCTAIEQVVWHPETGQLSFRITIPDGSETALTLLIPTTHQGSSLIQVRLDEQVVKAQRQEVGRLNYGLISVHTGSHQIMALYE